MCGDVGSFKEELNFRGSLREVFIRLREVIGEIIRIGWVVLLFIGFLEVEVFE